MLKTQLSDLNEFIRMQNRFNVHISKRVDVHDVEIDALRKLVIKSAREGISTIKKYLKR